MRRSGTVFAVAAMMLAGCATLPAIGMRHADLLIRGGAIYDGQGGPPFVGDVAVSGDRITYVGPNARVAARRVIDAKGLAVAPGFINVLSQAQETLVDHPEAQSDLRQGVTLEIMNEGDSPGPLSPTMRAALPASGPGVPPFAWTTLGQYMEGLERRGAAVNIATYVGAGTVRTVVLGEGQVAPTAAQLTQMRRLVRQAMEEGAVGVSSALIYVPGAYADTAELTALAAEAGRCGGVYASHIRSEGDRFLEGLAELIEIARVSGAPGHVFHLKVGGRRNWPKMAEALTMIERARQDGVEITADIYPYAASGTGLDASMPPWVREGGLDAWIARLRDPATRAKAVAEMQDPNPSFENVLAGSGPQGALVAGGRTDAVKALAGKTLAEIARDRGVSPEDAAIQLVVEDGSRVEMIYFTMTEDNLRLEAPRPYVGISSDAPAFTAAGDVLASSVHPRAYGAFARVFAKYVREEGLLTTQEAVRRMTSLPARTFHLKDRGALRRGAYADLVVFDPATIQDRATYLKPHAYATGVRFVVVNGVVALDDGEPTSARGGRFVRGRGWTGAPGGGCRTSGRDWPSEVANAQQ